MMKSYFYSVKEDKIYSVTEISFLFSSCGRASLGMVSSEGDDIQIRRS